MRKSTLFTITQSTNIIERAEITSDIHRYMASFIYINKMPLKIFSVINIEI